MGGIANRWQQINTHFLGYLENMKQRCFENKWLSETIEVIHMIFFIGFTRVLIVGIGGRR
jgi:hypothetical protein